MDIQEFIRKTNNSNTSNVRPRIVCNDGFNIN